MSFFVGDEGVGLAFAAGAGCRGNRDKREQWFGGFARSPVILHFPAVSVEKIAPLGRVHGTAAAEAYDEVDAVPLGDFEGLRDAMCCGIFFGLVEDGDFEPGSFKARAGSIGVAGFRDAGISDEKDACAAVFASELAELRDGASAENETRPRGEIKGRAGADEMRTGRQVCFGGVHPLVY